MSSRVDPRPDLASTQFTIEHLRNLILIRTDYIQDPDVLEWAEDWIARSLDAEQGISPQDPEAWTRATSDGTLGDYAIDRFSAITTRYSMYETAMSSDADAEFPSECEGCEHYGTACPIATRQPEMHRLREIADRSNKSQIVNGLREIAGDNNCHLIGELIGEWHSDEAELLAEGYKIYLATRDLINPLRPDEARSAEAREAVAAMVDNEQEDRAKPGWK